MRWLLGLHLGYEGIDDATDAGGRHFFTGNVSVKTELLRRSGGFDEAFGGVAHDDIDLGLRLEQLGMRLAWDRDAVAEHYQPTDLEKSLDRMHRAGRSLALLVERHPGRPVARRPGLRHRVKAGALTVLAATGVRNRRVQHETWRFLCHEAAREAYWDAVDERTRQRRSSDGLRIGRTLARLALRDEDAQMPDVADEGILRRSEDGLVSVP